VKGFDTPGNVALRIKLPSGRVTVTTSDEPSTTVDVVARGRRGRDAIEDIEVTMEERGGKHVVRVEHQDKLRWGPIQISWGGDFECAITCPTGSDLELVGGSTDLRVDGLLGTVSVKTASGGVKLDDVGGVLSVKTASGDVAVASVTADSSVSTVSGDLDIGTIDGEFTCHSISGDVTMGVVRSPVSLSTTSGDVVVRSVNAGDVRIATVSGDVRVGIARGTRVWVDAGSVSGRLESELGVGDQEPASEGDDTTVVPLHVKTVSGDVDLVRAADAVSA
jgi:putative adhesin